MRQRKLDRHVDEHAALKIVGVDDSLHYVEHGPELAQRRWSAALADDLAKGVLQPAALHLQGGQDEIFLALEVLVEGRLADADIGQHLVQADAAEAVAVKAPGRGLGQSLPCGGGHIAAPACESEGPVDLKSTQGGPEVNLPAY